jgi:hypothetical protein
MAQQRIDVDGTQRLFCIPLLLQAQFAYLLRSKDSLGKRRSFLSMQTFLQQRDLSNEITYNENRKLGSTIQEISDLRIKIVVAHFSDEETSANHFYNIFSCLKPQWPQNKLKLLSTFNPSLSNKIRVHEILINLHSVE